jgi:Domain of unknown function (DUF4157)
MIAATQQKIYFKENSFIAKCGAKCIKANNVALTIGNTIYLYNATVNDIIGNPIWLAHELVHVNQYQKLGIVKFVFLYLLECIAKGYYNNKFEIEARLLENNIEIIDEFRW